MSGETAKTPEEKDEEELREVEGKIKEVLDLLKTAHFIQMAAMELEKELAEKAAEEARCE